LFILLSIEIILRVFKPEITSVGFSKNLSIDSLYYNTYGLKPNSVGTSNGANVSVDKYGFRESNTPVNKNKNSWLLLGDSVTFGVGVANDSTFSALINFKIDSINILNPSMIGYNIENYFTLFNYFLIQNPNKFRIDKVILAWCLNDIYSNKTTVEIQDAKDNNILLKFLSYFRVNSRLYHFIKKYLFDRPKTYYMFDSGFYINENVNFKNAINIINNIKNYCNSLDICFELLLLPYEYQIRKNYFVPQKLLKKSLADEIIMIDFFQLHQIPANKSKKYYLYGDGIHFSAMGHKFIAEQYINYLNELNDIDPKN